MNHCYTGGMPNFVCLKRAGQCWYHFDKPLTSEDEDFLADKFPFSREDINNCKKKKTPKPKVNATSKYSYFIFHIPYLPRGSGNFAICELNVFVTNSVLVTVESRGNLVTLNEYLEKTQSSSNLADSRFKFGCAGLFVKLMRAIFSSLEELIDHQGEDIDRLHREIFSKRLAKKFVEHISVIRYNQVLAHNAIERQVHIFDQYRGAGNPLNRLMEKRSNGWNNILDSLGNL